ncbi:hypothetical protein LV779_37070 [Streptomyces thinghirensis]|nr:hypothetical protein [Streptomyces thinghirensis]
MQITMTHRQRKGTARLLPGSPGRDDVGTRRIARMDVEQQDGYSWSRRDGVHPGRRGEAAPRRRGGRARGAHGDRGPRSGGWTRGHRRPRRADARRERRTLRNWTLVETVGSGAPIRDLAFDLLAGAAARTGVPRGPGAEDRGPRTPAGDRGTGSVRVRSPGRCGRRCPRGGW